MNFRMLIALIIIIISSCEDKEVFTDPLNGQTNVFSLDGEIYSTTPGAYFLYDKIDKQFYYCILIGTTGSFVFSKNLNESYVKYGDFVRIFVQADSLDKFHGSYGMLTNESNIISISGQSEIIKSAEINLKTDLSSLGIIEIKATTNSGKKLDLRAQLGTGSVAYKIIRTVEGEFDFNSDSYDISRVSTQYSENDNKLTLIVGDESEAIGSQIVFYITKTENTIPGTYLGSQSTTENGFTGYVSIYDLIEGNQILNSGFNEGTLQIEQDGENYNISFDIKTFSGYIITGHYSGEILK